LMAKILWIRYSIPEFSRTGREGAIYNLLAGLAKKNEVHLAVLVDGNPSPETVNAIVNSGARIRTTISEDTGAGTVQILRRVTLRVISVLSLSPVDIWRYNKRYFKDEITYSVHEMKPDVVVFDQWFLYPTVQKLAAKRIFYAYDLEWLFNERFAEETDNIFLSNARTLRGGRRKVYEFKTFGHVDAVVCSSRAVADEVGRYYKRSLSIVPPPVERPRKTTAGKFNSREIIYATDRFAPRDATAIRWLAKFVIPNVRTKIPNATLTVSGEGAEDYIEPPSEKPWLRATSENVDDLFARASIAAFPHWSGGGANFAALNALAFGLPVVATPIGAEGIPGDNRSGVAVRLYAEKFAEEVINLLTNERIYAKRSAAASTYAETSLYGEVTAADFLTNE
jgi:glycosyltransferase involved in cell wall biosynthesis